MKIWDPQMYGPYTAAWAALLWARPCVVVTGCGGVANTMPLALYTCCIDEMYVCSMCRMNIMYAKIKCNVFKMKYNITVVDSFLKSSVKHYFA
jgi:hypothetical protein